MDRLRRIMARLRRGCPWDREQTHRTLRTYVLEEAYEVVDAIDEGDDRALIEELGDLLLQIVFHSRIAEEDKRFNLNDVITAVSEKLVRRHPHVFGRHHLTTSREVLKRWEQIKLQEPGSPAGPGAKTGRHGKKGALDGLPRRLPALLMAYRMQAKLSRLDKKQAATRPCAAVVGFRRRLAGMRKNERERFVGDFLMSVAGVAHDYGIDPEISLRSRCLHLRTAHDRPRAGNKS